MVFRVSIISEMSWGFTIFFLLKKNGINIFLKVFDHFLKAGNFKNKGQYVIKPIPSDFILIIVYIYMTKEDWFLLSSYRDKTILKSDNIFVVVVEDA